MWPFVYLTSILEMSNNSATSILPEYMNIFDCFCIHAYCAEATMINRQHNVAKMKINENKSTAAVVYCCGLCDFRCSSKGKQAFTSYDLVI